MIVYGLTGIPGLFLKVCLFVIRSSINLFPMIRFLYIYIKISSYILLRAVGCVCHDDSISVRSVKNVVVPRDAYSHRDI